jgi:hypothetical protein
MLSYCKTGVVQGGIFMIDYLKRIIIVLIMAICITIIIIGGRVQAAELNIKTSTDNWFFPAKGEISDIFDSREGKHKGIDIAGEYRSQIFAAEEGKVSKSYYSFSYGNVVFLHHPNGFETIYAHLAKRLVQKGDTVHRGETIGLMGNTGESTGTHLHFEVHEGDWTLDKRNAIDPFLVYGDGEIGQVVFALQHDPYGIADVTKPIVIEPQEEVLKPFYKAEELSIGLNANKETVYNTKIITALMDNEKVNQDIYIVKKGDTLINISEKFNVPMNELLSLNHIENKDLIFPLQKIIVKLGK